MKESDFIYTLSEVNFCYPGTASKALSDIDLNLPAGKFFGIIGPNGSGKSTLLKILSGWNQPDTGNVLYSHKPIQSFQRRQLASRISFLSQSETHPFAYRVKEIVAMGLLPQRLNTGKKEERALIDEEAMISKILQWVGVEQHLDRYTSSLSGGERQRVLLARTLAQNPETLLLDEPTTYLDPEGQKRCLSLIRSLVDEERLTAIGVFHDINLASAFCDHLIMLKEGKVFQSGPLSEVLTKENLKGLFQVDFHLSEDSKGRPWARMEL